MPFQIVSGVNGLEDINPSLYNDIVQLEIQIEQQTVECETLTNQINLLNEQAANIPYSVYCNETNMNYCLTEPEGLNAWAQILGETNWQVQLDDSLPTSLNQRIFIPRHMWHRTIKGTGPLRIKIYKN